jgi:hypothetical protein
MQLFLNISDLNDYSETVSKLRPLKAIADKRQISILMIHHANKSSGNESKDFLERALGSTGIAATCDTILCLTRPRNERRADLYITGRSIMDRVYTLQMDDNCGWTLEGDKREVIEGDTQKLIYDWLKDNGANGPTIIHKGLKEEGYEGTLSTVKNTLSRMARAGKLDNISGIYCIPSKTPIDPIDPIDQESNDPEGRSIQSIRSIPLSEENDQELEIY